MQGIQWSTRAKVGVLAAAAVVVSGGLFAVQQTTSTGANGQNLISLIASLNSTTSEVLANTASLHHRVQNVSGQLEQLNRHPEPASPDWRKSRQPVADADSVDGQGRLSDAEHSRAAKSDCRFDAPNCRTFRPTAGQRGGECGDAQRPAQRRVGQFERIRRAATATERTACGDGGFGRRIQVVRTGQIAVAQPADSAPAGRVKQGAGLRAQAWQLESARETTGIVVQRTLSAWRNQPAERSGKPVATRPLGCGKSVETEEFP
jgi:hypothetical protein